MDSKIKLLVDHVGKVNDRIRTLSGRNDCLSAETYKLRRKTEVLAKTENEAVGGFLP